MEEQFITPPGQGLIESSGRDAAQGALNVQSGRNMYLSAGGGNGNRMDETARRAGLQFINTQAVGQLEDSYARTVRDMFRGTGFEGREIENKMIEYAKSKDSSALGDFSITPFTDIAASYATEAVIGVGGDIGEQLGSREMGEIAGQTLANALIGGFSQETENPSEEKYSNPFGGFGGAGVESEGAAAVSMEEAKQATRVIDRNQNGAISQRELEKAASDPKVYAELNKINPTLARLLLNPNFRTRIIKRRKIPSAYKPDPFAAYQQVDLIEQGRALDNLETNRFNTGF